MANFENSINNLLSVLWLIPRGLGIWILIQGIQLLATGFSEHQNAQKWQGALTIIGGLMLFFARELLRMITGDTTI